MGIYYSAVVQGILWSLMGIGLYLTFRILRFADLTSEASFTIGGAVAAASLTHGVHPLLALGLSLLAGFGTGLVTGILMTYFKIPSLLSGIITLTGFYSINLRIMGKANLSLRNTTTIYQALQSFFRDTNLQVLIVGLILVVLVIGLLGYFFKTDLGQSLIATGDNEIMAQSLGISVSFMKCLALILSNGIIALSGALIAQQNGFADVSMGVGTVITALASIIIGEVLFKELSLVKRLGMIVLGAILYRVLLVFVLQLGFEPNDFRLISALILAVFLALPTLKQRVMKE